MKTIGGTSYFDKREALDHIALCASKKIPVHGLEVVAIDGHQVKSDLNKSLWFKSQRGVYKSAKLFLMRQMVGEWNWAEIKSE